MSKYLLQSYQSQLAVMKQRIMVYLGSLGGSINHSLLAGSEEKIAKQAIAWDSEQHLKFYMPFVDMKPTIYLGLTLFHILIFFVIFLSNSYG